MSTSEEIDKRGEIRKRQEQKITNNVNHTSKEQEIQIRQQKVWGLFLQGFSQQKIAKELNVSLKTISRDFQDLKTESMKWMDALPEGEIQLHHRKNLESIEKVIQEFWDIYENTEDENKKLKLLNFIAEKSKLHSQMMQPNNLLKVRQDVQNELRYKNIYGYYPRQA